MITPEKIVEIADKAWMEPVYKNNLFPPSVYYRFMKLLTLETQPAVSVVLGVCGGGDCLHLLLGKEHKVYGIDVAWDHPMHIYHLRTLYRDWFTFLRMDSVEASITFDAGSVDILFIDTIHTYERTMGIVTGKQSRYKVRRW